MKFKAFFLWIAFFSFLVINAQDQRVRTIVTTDGEIDDVDTFIRMLLYANEFKLEGLIYSSSMWHYRGDGTGTEFTSKMKMTKEMYGPKTDLRWPGTQWIQDLVQAYAKVYFNLIQHSVNYPSPEYLMSLIRVGNVNFEGEMEQRTAGSEFIAAKLVQNDTSDLFLQAWGGTNTIARALKSIEEDFKGTDEWNRIYQLVSNKAIIYTIMDQDDTYQNYISKVWPDIRVYYNAAQFAAFAYPWKRIVPKTSQKYLEGTFMGPEIINNHGPLLKKYYSYGDGQQQEGDDEHIHGDLSKIKDTQWGSFERYDFISEGDTPAYLHLVDIGLQNYSNPTYGGWGGRFLPSKKNPNVYKDGDLVTDLNPETKKQDLYYPQTRWIEAIQNDFAARADWCITTFEEANHPPRIDVEQPKFLKIKAGAHLKLRFNSADLDGDQITHKVWNYTELSTVKVKVEHNQQEAFIEVDQHAKKGDVIHLVVEGTDNGYPALTRYQRVVLQVN